MNSTSPVLITLARKIAIQVGIADLVNGLQPLARLKTKFVHELEELHLARAAYVHAVADTAPEATCLGCYAEMHLEAADCLYYAVCCEAQRDSAPSRQLVSHLAALGLSLADVKRVAVVKYAWRAGGGAKDDVLERVLAGAVLTTGEGKERD